MQNASFPPSGDKSGIHALRLRWWKSSLWPPRITGSRRRGGSNAGILRLGEYEGHLLHQDCV
jgi:hypothetical protein